MPSIEQAQQRSVPDLHAALQDAIDNLRELDLDAAEQRFNTLRDQWPGQPDVLHFHGLLKLAQGQPDHALALVSQASELAPGHAGIWNNLGNILVDIGRIDEAEAAYQRCLQNDPQAVQALNNLGVIHRKKGRWAEAEAHLRQALDQMPDFADAMYNLSEVLVQSGRIAEGIEANSRAVMLMPRDLVGRESVLRALILLGEVDQAAVLYREWLAEDPDNPVVLHNLAACLKEAAPARASDAYVETVFDGFALSFDGKLAKLGYRAPELVAEALKAVLPAPARQLQVVDLGCGTGLCGPLVRDWAAHLAGCDLSVGMLRRAKARGGYDVLHKAELVYYLATQREAFDVAISADTLCYFGELGPAMTAAAGALKPGGVLAFTVEALPPGADEPYRLQLNGRYAHGQAYVERCLAQAGLHARTVEAEVLRQEGGRDVPGWLVVALR